MDHGAIIGWECFLIKKNVPQSSSWIQLINQPSWAQTQGFEWMNEYIRIYSDRISPLSWNQSCLLSALVWSVLLCSVLAMLDQIRYGTLFICWYGVCCFSHKSDRQDDTFVSFYCPARGIFIFFLYAYLYGYISIPTNQSVGSVFFLFLFLSFIYPSIYYIYYIYLRRRDK